jgi:hypothetical protein
MDKMKSTNQELDRLFQLRERLGTKCTRLSDKLDEAKTQFSAVCLTIELLCGNEEREAPLPVAPRELQGMTQLEAMVYMARKNSGRLKTKDAARLLLEAGLMRKTKNSYNIAYTVIRRSEKFKPSGIAGEYELIEEEGPKQLRVMAS